MIRYVLDTCICIELIRGRSQRVLRRLRRCGVGRAERREGEGELGLGWESGGDWTPDANFRLYLSGGEGLIDTRLLPYRERDDDGYFSLLFAPVIELDEAVARDVVIVLDRSGSMEGEKMAQAINAAEYVLDNLGSDDRFAVVDFSRYVRWFEDELRPASEAAAGIDYVRDLAAGGNTNISGALERAMEYLDGERPDAQAVTGLPLDERQRLIDLGAEGELARTQVERLRIRVASLDQKLVNLSGGNQQKVVLARWLADRCRVLLFDEPTRGIDVGAKAEIYELIGDLVDHGVAILLISSEMSELIGLSDRVAVMHEGVIQGILRREEATQERIMELALQVTA